jgi:hypothetical protein
MKTARIAIFLTGMIGLAMGGLMSLSSIQSQQEESVLRVNDSLKIQAQAYVDQFFGILEAVRTGANPDYVINRYEVSMVQGVPSEIESSKKNLSKEAQNNEMVDLALEDRLLSALKNQVSFSDLKLMKFSIGTYEMSEISSKEGIFVAFPSDSEKSTVISKINVVLIDPANALVSFPKLHQTANGKNAFLISRSGRVLAHTSSPYVGTDLRKAEGLKNTIENLFIGAQTGAVATYRSIDGSKEQVAFVRAGVLPFAIGVEQQAVASVFSSTWFEEQVGSGAARKAVGSMIVFLAISLALFSVVSIYFNRRIQSELKVTRFKNRMNHAEKQPPQFSKNDHSKPVFDTDERIMGAAEDFVVSKTQIEQESRQLQQAASGLLGESPSKAARGQSSTIKVHRDYSDELSNRVKQSKSPEEIEAALVQLTSELSESPTLYFRYHRKLQNLTLSSVAGSVPVKSKSLFQAFVRKDIEEQIESFAKEGKVASLSNYGPMSKMLISQLNVAHFEAWALTSESEVSGTPQMVGVLVVLNAGYRSAQSRPILSKMLKESGNYLFAQNNRIAPRARSIRPTPSVSSELNS